MSRRKRFTRNLGRKPPQPAPVRTTVEWIRFEHEHEPYGVFTYLKTAKRALRPKERARLDTLYEWFVDQLGAPEEGKRARAWTLATLARFWFREEAFPHVQKARELARLVSEAGIPIVERRTSRIPGKVKWEDSHQAAVLTYRDAPQPKRRAADA